MTFDVELAGIAFFAVGAGVASARARPSAHRPGLPDDFVEALDAAVEVVGGVVGGEGVFLAVEGELALGDAVAVAADEAPK